MEITITSNNSETELNSNSFDIKVKKEPYESLNTDVIDTISKCLYLKISQV